MNRQAKSAIKSLVLTLRHKLEDDIAIQLKRYGFAGQRWLDLERLPHIQRDDQATIDYHRLKTALEQELRRMGVGLDKAKPKQRAEAVDWFVREIAFTHLNRLIALKCLEVRDLIPEIITTREAYGGRSRAHYDYRHAHPDEARRPDDALPAAIRHICRQVHAEFKLLFDVGDPAVDRRPPVNAIIWPSYPVLKECIRLINDLDGVAGVIPDDAQHGWASLWAEDEIIGWIYQFYNAEQKEAIRKRGKPRRPTEVAVINQFFTPRWIVKFLVDNTLGRLWLEMHPDSERVRTKCDYLVPEPLPTDGTQYAVHSTQFALDPDSPINNPHAPPRRDPKCPQDIRLIDPACGTMHFGHYAFEVFQEIYRDARDSGWVAGDDALPDAEIPAAILRHNLYGVDIDLRAVQLAGLSLFIKAKSASPDAHVSHVNLVVADAVLPADGARKQFLAQYKDNKDVQNAVRQVLDEMENVAEVGSLLRVEERLREELAKAGHTVVQDFDDRRMRELPGFEPPTRQLSLAEVASSDPEQWGAHYTLARLLNDLRAFAAQALQTHDLNAQLFAEEAEKSVHLLDVFLNDYDVVVMNPPYGETTLSAKRYLKQAYPRTSNDVYASFFERILDLLSGTGYAGALTSRTFLFLSRFQKLREDLLLQAANPIAVLDLGFGILDDAMVETCASVLSVERTTDTICRFYRVNQFDDRELVLSQELRGDEANDICCQVPLSEFRYLPRAPFAYWASSSLRQAFREYPSFEPAFGIVRQGKATGHDQRFTRQWWEVPGDALNRHWVPFAKGGEYSKYFFDVDLVIDWSPEAQELHAVMGNGLPNQQHYFRKGLTYPRVTVKGLNVRFLPSGCVFADKGPSIFAPNDEDVALGSALAYLNSSLAQTFLLMLTPSRSFEVGYVSQLPYAQPTAVEAEQRGHLARQAHNLKAAWDTGNETCTRFDAPWLVQAHRGTLLTTADGRPLIAELDIPDFQSPISNLQSLLDYVHAVEQAADARLQQLQAQIDKAVYDLYDISPEDRALIERELGDRPPELVWPQMEGKSDKEKRREHVRRLISYFLLQALKEKRDGVLPLVAGTGHATALDEVRRRMEAEFGEDAAFRMETEIKRVLGRSIADWLDGPFIKWHTRLYKRLPIIWQLSSSDYHHTFNCFVYYHRLDRDTLRKVQTLYLWPQRRTLQSELDAARRDQRDGVSGASTRVEDAETALEILDGFEQRLLSVIEGNVQCDIPDWAEGPYRAGIYDPMLDDGVKVNITPLQEAELLRYKKLV